MENDNLALVKDFLIYYYFVITSMAKIRKQYEFGFCISALLTE